MLCPEPVVGSGVGPGAQPLAAAWRYRPSLAMQVVGLASPTRTIL